jgi:hypothetical protein
MENPLFNTGIEEKKPLLNPSVLNLSVLYYAAIMAATGSSWKRLTFAAACSPAKTPQSATPDSRAPTAKA